MDKPLDSQPQPADPAAKPTARVRPRGEPGAARQRVPIGNHQPELIMEDAAEQPRRKKRPPSRRRMPAHGAVWPTTWSFTKATILTFLAALLVATVFSYWTPEDGFETEEFRVKMNLAQVTQVPMNIRSTSLPTQVVAPRIGIIAGHSGPPLDPSFDVDPGAVCDDNFDGIPELTELEINTEVADLIAGKLLARGYEVNLLHEFDDALNNYRADALVSIHTNDCQNYGLGATGFNVVGPYARGVTDGLNEALVRCLINEYGTLTALERHFGVTEDMTLYHTFDEVSVDTPVAIIEIGFMFSDRQMLTQDRELIADGIVAGIVCFIEPPNVLTPIPPPN